VGVTYVTTDIYINNQGVRAVTPSNTRASQASQVNSMLIWVRESVHSKTTVQGYGVNVTKDNDSYTYIAMFLNHVLGSFTATSERASMETARDNANLVCEQHLALLPLRRAAYAKAGGQRLADVGHDLMQSLNEQELEQVIVNPDSLTALQKSKVLPAIQAQRADDARNFASDRVSSLPYTSDTLESSGQCSSGQGDLNV